MSGRRCVYASATRGIHDARWVAALEAHGWEPRVIVRGDDEAEDDAAFRQRVADAAEGAPILAGPIDTVTLALTGLPHLVGLSWGFDLHRMSAEDRSKVRELGGIIIDSPATKAIAADAGLADETITFLPWGVDLAAFTPDGPRWDPAEAGLPGDALIVLSLRAHEPLYRVLDIIEAFPHVLTSAPDAVLVVGNDGSLRGELEQAVSRLGIGHAARFLGRMDEAALPALLRRTDCYVSASEIDGSSVTLLQAMACGAPVVVSANAGNAGIVEDGVTGVQFPIGDSSGLASAVVRTLSAGRVGSEAALAWVRSHADWVGNGTRLDEAMRRAAGGVSASQP